jgi:hypothetical protein
VRIFKNKWFSKFAGKEGISDEKLVQAIKDAQAGKIDADLGGGVIKQRIARSGEGKSGGYRSIILYRSGDRALFVYGFAKNERANMSAVEEREYKAFAKTVFAFTDKAIARLIETGAWQEVKEDD